jgi:TonB family protein
MVRSIAVLLALAACSRRDDATVNLPSRPVEAPPATDLTPVAVNPNSPVEYPPALAQQGLEGTVLLHLFVDTTGRAVPESTRVAESSGYPALDSAALKGAPSLRFAPGQREGVRVPMAFLQPVHFRTALGRGVTP